MMDIAWRAAVGKMTASRKVNKSRKENHMKYLMMIAIALVYFMPAAAQASSAKDQISAMHKRFYKEEPDTKREIKDAVRYAVFSKRELVVL